VAAGVATSPSASPSPVSARWAAEVIRLLQQNGDLLARRAADAVWCSPPCPARDRGRDRGIDVTAARWFDERRCDGGPIPTSTLSSN